MTTLTPFNTEFCGDVHKVYSVNSYTPEKEHSNMTTSEICPHCKERNIFRVYEPKREFETDRFAIAIYDCKCPNCKKDFEIKDEFDKEED